jgi:hypothetical protein
MTPTKRPIILPGDAEVYGNLDVKGNEIQNANMQNLQTAPQDATEGRFYMDTVNHKPKIHNGTEFVDFGKTYTDGNGININDGEISIDESVVATLEDIPDISGKADDNTVMHLTGNEQAKGIKKFAVDNGSMVLLTEYNISSEQDQGIGIITLDYWAETGKTSLKIGGFNDGQNPLVLTGKEIYIQGSSSSTYYKLINRSTGKIIDDRISSNIARTSDIPTVPTTLSSFTDDLGSSPTHTHSQYLNSSLKGANNGLAELDANGKIPTSQIPGSIDEVIDSYIVSGATALSSGWLSKTSGGSALTPETGVIYVVLSSGAYLNKTYRWSGSTYVEISASPGQATESSAGIAEIATTAEVTAGTDDTRMVTPLKLAGALSGFVKKYATNNPALTVTNNYGTWTINTGISSSDLNVNFYDITNDGNSVIYPSYNVNNGVVTAWFYSTSNNISADKIRVVVTG